MNASYILPDLVLLANYNNQDEFIDFIYKIFNIEFQTNTLKFRSQKINLRKQPTGTINGIEYDWTFHHIITTERKQERIFDKDRAERINFPSSFIKNETKLFSWSLYKNNETKYYISNQNFDYLVVLSQRRDYIMLLSAFNITTNNYKRKLKKEYESTIKPDFIL